MTKPIRWGILGTGSIAHTFTKALRDDTDSADVVAVGSRTEAEASSFAETFGIERAYSSYEALAADPDVEVMYIATPHVAHKANTLLCLDAGKHVLCEKPMGLNQTEVQEMVRAARDKELFLMEALWTRFLPHMTKLKRLVDEGALGELRMLQASFGFRIPVDVGSRLFDPHLGGGSLLDVGVYSVMLAQWLFGTPEKVVSFANLGETGVDEETAFMLRYRGGQVAQLSSAVRLQLPDSLTLIGTEGIALSPDWWRPSSLEIKRWRRSEIFRPECRGSGYAYEAEEVARCVRAGKLESAAAPHEDSLAIHATLDELRRQWGLVYPQEA